MYDSYRGNPNLKRVDELVEWTPELILEYKRCMEDPIYFAQKYVKVVHVDRGFIPIDLYPYQEEAINAISTNRRVIMLTARQAGKTTTAVILVLHYILFNSYKSVAVLSNKDAGSKEILSRIKLAYEALPKWLQQGVLEWNKGNISLENGSKVVSAATSSSSVRGGSYSLIYIDEMAFINGWDEFYTSTYPTISSGETTKLFMTSTPNGLNHFYKFWSEAGKGTNGFIPILATWDKVPGRDDKWKMETLQALNFDMDRFNQEYNGQFLGSSGTLISGEKLKTLVDVEPIAKQSNSIKIWEPPSSDKRYSLIADVSRGKGLDYSTFSVLDITEMPYKQVCTFRDNLVTPTDFASYIHNVANMYNQAYVLVEINDIGGQVADLLLLDLGYENLLMTKSAGRSGKRIASWGGATDRGIRTSVSVKAVGCSVLKLLLEQEQLIVNDKVTIDELKRFSRKGNSYEAESGSHDDMVMTLVLFAWLTTDPFFKEELEINTIGKLRDKSEEEIMEEMLPLGYFDDGTDDSYGGEYDFDLVR